MKILQLRFSNINSLKGSFSIDFTDPKLCAGGIFAITGPTGSGKSTILNAVTLALYGSTPRLAKLATENELMTRGTTTCQAEVDFETRVDGRVMQFRSTWSQHYSKNGNLQNAKVRLVQLSDKQKGDEWDVTKKGEVYGNIETLTGLDYHRFTRTCLLAQGKFAAFMEAGGDERAKILEQITGTDIYSELSKKSYEMHKEKQQQILTLQAQLEGITLMSDEEYAALEIMVEGLDKERQAVDGKRQQVHEQISWLLQLEKFAATRDELLKQQDALQSECRAKEPDLKRLADGRRAEPLRYPLEKRGAVQKKQAEKGHSLEASAVRLKEVREGSTKLTLLLDECRKNLAHHQQVLAKEQILLKSVRALDHQLAGAQEARLAITAKKGSLLVDQQTTEKQVVTLTQQLTEMAEKQAILTERQKANQIDKHLGGDLKVLEVEITEQQKTTAQLSELQRQREAFSKQQVEAVQAVQDAQVALKKVQAIVQEKQSAWEQAVGQLETDFQKQTLESLQGMIQDTMKALNAAENLCELREELAIALKEEAELQALSAKDVEKLQELTGAVANQQKELDRQTVELENLQEEKEQCQLRASLDDYRAQLTAGSPCPLCGSPDHPFVTESFSAQSELSTLENRLKELKRLEKASKTALKQAEKAQQKQAESCASHEATKLSLKKAILACQKKWEKVSAELGIEVTATDEQAVVAEVSLRKEAHQQAQKGFAEFQKAQKAVDKAEKALNKSQTLQQKTENQQTKAQGSFDRLQVELTGIQNQEKNLVAASVEQLRRMQERILPYGLVEFDDEVLPSLRLRWQTWEQNENDLERLQKDEQAAKNILTEHKSTAKSLCDQLHTIEKELVEQTRKQSDLQKQRSDLYGGKDPDQEEKKLLQEVEDILAQEKDLSTRAHEAKVAIGSLEATLLQHQKDLTALKEEALQIEQQITQSYTEAGFADEASAAALLLDVEELTRLEVLAKDLNERQAQLKGQVQIIAEQISAHEEKRKTDQSLEDLQRLEAEFVSLAQTAKAQWQEQWKLLAAQQQARTSHQGLLAKISVAEEARRPWAKLADLIGSADGKKFRDYAYGLTFANLIYHANEQLKQFNDRYLLANVGLELFVIDRYMADTKATVKNLSGGERFLASLALALGLAQLVGQRHQMDTLFIDEGFGALDPDALETAIDTLCSLQQQGKLIGVISHVESLKERLSVRLDLRRLGGGFSTIDGPGVAHIA